MVLVRSLSLAFLLLWGGVSNVLSRSVDAQEGKESPVVQDHKEKEQWFTIFVHGSSGAPFGLMSFAQVLRDKPQGTLYHKIQQMIRRNVKYFYRNRLMSDSGLVMIGSGKEVRSYPDRVTTELVTIYQEVSKHLTGKSDDIFYAYGWNGLLSQTERRKEAVRLYNELSAIVEECRSNDVIPKIRFICHSHGGNVVLNLAAIQQALEGHTELFCPAESVQRMAELFHSLDELVEKEGESYALPTLCDFTVDELIMYGAPIQEETEGFSAASFFKKVYNIYSNNDVIQPADFISTSARKSSRKISLEKFTGLDVGVIKQARITINHHIGKVKSKKQNDSAFSVKKLKEKVNIKAPLRGGKLISSYPYDPSHADFWCIGWNKKDVFFDPLPLLVFTPVFLQLMEDGSHDDMIINIAQELQHEAKFVLTDSREHESFSSEKLPIRLIKRSCRRIAKAKPKSFTYDLTLTIGGE